MAAKLTALLAHSLHPADTGWAYRKIVDTSSLCRMSLVGRPRWPRKRPHSEAPL